MPIVSLPKEEIAAGGEEEAHASEHESGGADEISVANLLGVLANAQVPQSHNLGGGKHASDVLADLNALISDATLDDQGAERPPSAHSGEHQDGGADEINVGSLSGVLADAQTPQTHASDHEDGGADEVTHNNLALGSDDHHADPTAGTGIIDEGTNKFGQNVVLSGQVTLSSGVATVDTTLSATDATFMLALGIDDPNADCELAGRVFWDDSAGTYKIKILEQNTSVGNPTVNYDVVRVR